MDIPLRRLFCAGCFLFLKGGCGSLFWMMFLLNMGNVHFQGWPRCSWFFHNVWNKVSVLHVQMQICASCFLYGSFLNSENPQIHSNRISHYKTSTLGYLISGNFHMGMLDAEFGEKHTTGTRLVEGESSLLVASSSCLCLQLRHCGRAWWRGDLKG